MPNVSTTIGSKGGLIQGGHTFQSSHVRPVQPLRSLPGCSGDVWGRVRKYLDMCRPTPTPSLTSTAGWYTTIRAHLYSTDASSWDGTLAEVNAYWIMQLTAACRGCQPSLYGQLRPWVARSSTMVPQLMNSCGQQRGVLSLKPTATRVVYSSIQS